MPAMPIRPFRFGVNARTAASRADWVELARRVEALGYDTLGLPDHFDDQLAPIPALQCAADATTTLRLGAMVFDNDYRHPLVLAKELATMDVLSDGRVQVGLGAGWTRADYEKSGIGYDPPGVRITRMIEGLQVIRGAFGRGSFSFSGEHYTISDYEGFPKPVQTPPPVLIGGGGPRVLRMAAQHADIVGINSTLTSGAIDRSTFDSMTAEAVDAKAEVVRDAARAAGRLDEIELSVRAFMVAVTGERQAQLELVAQVADAAPEAIAASPFALVGTPDQLVEDLLERRQRWGFSYIVVGQAEVDSFAPVVATLAGR